MFNLYKSCGAIFALALGVQAWHIDGEVVSSRGASPVAGVAVSVVDSQHISPVQTNAQGRFSITRQATTSILTINQQETPQEKNFSLFDLAGRRLATANLEYGKNIPTSVLTRQIASNHSGSFPRLRLQRSGFADTLFTLTRDSMSNVRIVMRDTTTVAVSCPSPALRQGEHRRTVRVGGVERSFILRVPAAYAGTSPVPLVVDFHPLGGSGSGQMNSSPYRTLTDPEGVVTAYPDGLRGPSGGAWNVGPCCVANANDTGFARALVADVRSVACVDPKRVYATGFSMGGGMSHYSACHLSDIFAAVAPAAFDLLQENQGTCSPARPIPVIAFRSTGDFVVSYSGGLSSVVQGMPITFLGGVASHSRWAQINSCTGQPVTDANGCSTYQNCAGGVQVTLCTRQGGGHDQGNAQIGWPWLKRFTLP